MAFVRGNFNCVSFSSVKWSKGDNLTDCEIGLPSFWSSNIVCQEFFKQKCFVLFWRLFWYSLSPPWLFSRSILRFQPLESVVDGSYLPVRGIMAGSRVEKAVVILAEHKFHRPPSPPLIKLQKLQAPKIIWVLKKLPSKEKKRKPKNHIKWSRAISWTHRIDARWRHWK